MTLPLPPDPDTSMVVRRLREYKQLLNAQDAETMIVMAERWHQLENTLEAQISLLAREVNEMRLAGEVVGINRLSKLNRYQTLLVKLKLEMGRYDEWAINEIAVRQELLGRLGIEHSINAIQLSYAEAGMGIGIEFNRLPVSAVENMIGIAGPGGPLGDLLQEAFPASAEHMTNALIEGVALGLPPGETARRMMNGMAVGLNRITTIARTEQLRVYREASRQQYVASGAVQEYERLAAKLPNTCMACIALDGTVYLTSELMEVHPNDRCTMIPLVAGVPRIERELASDWFAKQDPGLQSQMMGPGKFALYEQEKIGLQDLATSYVHPIWGPSIGITSLADLQQ